MSETHTTTTETTTTPEPQTVTVLGHYIPCDGDHYAPYRWIRHGDDAVMVVLDHNRLDGSHCPHSGTWI